MTGAVRTASTPASFDVATSGGGTCAHASTTRTAAKRSSERIIRATCRPSAPGRGIVEDDDVDRAAAAVGPVELHEAVDTGRRRRSPTSTRWSAAPRRAPGAPRWRRRRGPAARTRLPACDCERPTLRVDAGSKAAVNQNVLPCPGSLSTPISPPNAVTICRLIARPSPVPPYSRVVEESPCENDSNSRERTSGWIPAPVSVTSTRSTGPRRGHPVEAQADDDAAGIGELHGVRREVGDDLAEAHRVAGHHERHVRPVGDGQVEGLGARSLAERARRCCSSTAAGSKSTDSSSRRPASIFDRSRMSLTRSEQDATGLVDAVGQTPLVGGQLGAPEQLGEADDAVERGADLVAHRREELRLGARGVHARRRAPRPGARRSTRGRRPGRRGRRSA